MTSFARSIELTHSRRSMSGCLSHNAAEKQGVEATALAHSVHCHASDAYLGTCQTRQMEACSAMSLSMLNIRALVEYKEGN